MTEYTYARTKNSQMANEILNKLPVVLDKDAVKTTPGHRSAIRLRTLRFDPLQELVNKYRELEREVERQEKIRDGIIVELNAKGQPRSYRPEVHHAIYEKLINISDKLLRYAYARVPEEVVEDRPTAPLVVNLTKKGETYVVNDEPEIIKDEADYEPN